MMRNKCGFTLIEFLVVAGVFALIMGAGFTLLTTGNLSVGLTEAQVQAAERARLALQKICRQLRLSEAGRIFIYDQAGGATVPAPNQGEAVYFQVPVLNPEGALDLDANFDIKWGSEDTEGAYLLIYLDPDSEQLIQAACAALGDDGRSADKAFFNRQIIATHISTIRFNQVASGSALINILVTAQGNSARQTAASTLRSGVTVRN